MGKNWDKVVMGVEYWKECLRVLKDGAFCFVMSAPRQDVLSRAIVNLQDAGFNVGFTSLYHAYASGFPKASNIGKMVDKRLGLTKTEKGFNVAGQGIGLNPNRKLRSDNLEYVRPKGKSKEAKELDGSYGGFQPKPAVEVIVVAMKPITEKTYVDQAMKNGKGITWLDDCRVPYESEDLEEAKNRSGKSNTSHFGNSKHDGWNPTPQGRFPANILVSDDVLNDGRVIGSSYRPGNRDSRKASFDFGSQEKTGQGYNDSGSFSRYFSLDQWWAKTFPFLIVAKASKREKNEGLEGFEEKEKYKQDNSGQSHEIFSKNNLRRNPTTGELQPRRESEGKTKNIHPCCKPLKLMSYLIVLGSREGDVVLDPFAGSGTTCIAAKILKRKYIGIEMNEEYIKIAEARLSAVRQETLL